MAADDSMIGGSVVMDEDDGYRVGRVTALSEAECLALLATQAIGRIAFVDTEGQPMVLPVNFLVRERTVAWRSDPGTMLTGATQHAVAFEIDGIDPLYHEGWSVVVKGIGEDITHATESWAELIRSQPLTPWAGGRRSRWMIIADPSFSGRRIRNG